MYELNPTIWRELIDSRGELLHSIVLPTQSAGPQTRQNAIRFKNLLKEIEQHLAAHGADSDTMVDRLAEASALVDNQQFWQHQRKGLAVYFDGSTTVFSRAAEAEAELATTEPHFHLLPLIEAFERDRTFYVLALSENNASLFRVSGEQVEELEIVDAPSSLAEAMGRAGDVPTPSLQYHTGTSTSGLPQSGARPATYHGQGTGSDQAQHKRRLEEFCHLLNTGLVKTLAGVRAPLVLAAAEPLLSMFAALCAYPGLTDRHVEGNPEPIDPTALREAALKAVEPVWQAPTQHAVEAYRERVASDLTSDELDHVLPAALDGQVESLLVATGERQWGRFDEAQRSVERHASRRADSEELLNAAAVLTLRSGGAVHRLPAEQMPGAQPLAAVFRYPSPRV